MFRIQRPKKLVVHFRHGWPNRSWHIPALMGISSLLLAFCLVLGVMELGTGDSSAPVQEAALLESALEESSQGAVGLAFSCYEEPQPITEEEAAATLESLRDIFPDGSYWNHMGLEEWDEFTVTDIPCDHDLYWDTYCNSYTGRHPGAASPSLSPWSSVWALRRCSAICLWGGRPCFHPLPTTPSCGWETISGWN